LLETLHDKTAEVAGVAPAEVSSTVVGERLAFNVMTIDAGSIQAG
jgi:nucleoside-triphosphatase THEP1